MGHGLFWPFVNFLILVGVLAYYLRQPIKTFVDARSKRVGHDVAIAAKALAGARAELAEHLSKLQAIKAEADSLKGQATQEAEAISVRIVSDARRGAAEILEDAQRAAKNTYGDLRRELALELIQRSFAQVEVKLVEKLNPTEKQKLYERFSEQVARSK